MSDPTLYWAHDWPLPSWLGREPGWAYPNQITLRTADGVTRTGELARVSLRDGWLSLAWTSEPEQDITLPWDSLTSIHLVSPLRAGQPAPADNRWDREIPHQLLAFELRTSEFHGHESRAGHSMGYLSASHGLYLYVERPDGSYHAIWYSARALSFVQVGQRIWSAHRDMPVVQPAEFAVPAEPAPPPQITTAAQLEAEVVRLRAQPARSVEEVITDLGYLSPEELQAALSRAGSSGFLLGVLLKDGLLTMDQWHHVLARLAGLPEVDLSAFRIGPDARVMSWRDAMRYGVCPLGATSYAVYVASSMPTQRELVLLLSSLLNRRVELVWAAGDAIQQKLSELESTPPPPPTPAAAGTPAPVPKLDGSMADMDLSGLLAKAIAETDVNVPGQESLDVSPDSSFVQLVRRIIQDAKNLNASDIHIETNPGQKLTRVRLRRDGDLEPYLELPSAMRSALVSRIKVMARLDISERRRPQDGKINFADFGGSELELRVAVLPTHDGLEDVVMRLLASSKPIPLSRLGFQPRDETKVMAMSGHSYGLILAAGPTGSGKTTTLHSMLKELNTDQRKIWTAEDPIEITQEGLRQVQVNPKIGVTFAAAMRAFLRADPDVIMIGEIRDAETAKIAIEASLTGHLVLSTLHTNNASESVVRLLDIGMDPLNFSDSLVGIVAQRLVRALCPRCATGDPLTAEGFDHLVHDYILGSPLDMDEGRRRLLEAAGVSEPTAVVVKHAVGCAHCGNKGYKGRMGVYEVLENNERLRELIQKNARPAEIYAAAIGFGMRSLRHDAMEKMVQGKIDSAQARAAYA